MDGWTRSGEHMPSWFSVALSWPLGIPHRGCALVLACGTGRDAIKAVRGRGGVDLSIHFFFVKGAYDIVTDDLL